MMTVYLCQACPPGSDHTNLDHVIADDQTAIVCAIPGCPCRSWSQGPVYVPEAPPESPPR